MYLSNNEHLLFFGSNISNEKILYLKCNDPITLLITYSGLFHKQKTHFSECVSRNDDISTMYMENGVGGGGLEGLDA